MDISLTPKLEQFVRRKVASGLYNNAGEVFRYALGLMVERDNARTETERKELPTKKDIGAELAALEKPLRERGIASLALFGSTVRGQERADSDIDVLVDIDPKASFSLIDLVSVKLFLENRLGREVDVVTRRGIESAMRDSVVSEAESVF